MKWQARVTQFGKDAENQRKPRQGTVDFLGTLLAGDFKGRADRVVRHGERGIPLIYPITRAFLRETKSALF
jgi:hypothetical protein